ncbi:NACHT, LRR and PYD domains-containing protein 3 [Triplophysa tibetana]|uniref:NACHT, LRR and PYD domains-containing protein 3 n=1 Tax=Triplophysa tibetana TaxID=1572043 RepID=A0A5A9PC97_9TELE|nr:NACHT, LRR and PYD domains-containing protein 3 [Triplophysa tibetana]
MAFYTELHVATPLTPLASYFFLSFPDMNSDVCLILFSTDRTLAGTGLYQRPITQTSGADVKSSESSKPKYMKRSREIKDKKNKNKRQDFGVQDIVHQYKLSVKTKYESVLSFLCGEQLSFSALYTEPVIVQKNANGSFKKICVLDLFMLFDPITVVLRGNSGSGKSIIAQKIILDWASEAVPAKRFDLVFYLRCEELMRISEEMNFIELLSCSCSLTTVEISHVLQQPPEDNDVLFIIDGFDELKLTHDIYHHMSPYADPLLKAPPEVIICALLRGRILPESFLLVTTRTEDTVKKLLKGQSYFTEMMGFYEKEVERYFHKGYLVKAYYSLIANETLFTACSNPAICRIIIEKVKYGPVTNMLEMTTDIYIDFEFFTALYYVLLDEEESQKRVQELLHTVERGWAFTSWTDRDVSVADSEISTSKWLEPVIPFLCGLCKKAWNSTVFEKHNLTVSTSRESQLKEWISQFSQRYQNEHMLLILHCLYELHDKSFVWTILQGLILIDLSKIPLKMTDCWVLKNCLQCCEHIRNLKLQVTSDNLKMLQPELYRCKELCDLREEEVRLLTYLQSVSDLKKVCLQVSNLTKKLASHILYLIQSCLSLTVLRFLCQHAGQFRCSLTNLVFVMEGEGKMMYNIVSWDPHLLDGLGQMQPAGPLYNIECTGSVSQLHLPHCEIFSEENKDGFAVAHFTEGNLEMIQPLNVTGTHVIINIKELSVFGLIKSFFSSPIAAQVLLFLRPVTAEQNEKILNVHLLPGNVPVSESEMFESNNFIENYHPMFEVFLDVNSKEVRLSIVDKFNGGKEVWNRRRIILTESEFLNRHRDELIQRVSSVMVIADGLKSKNMIYREMYSKVHAAEPRQEKMRLLLEVIDSGGNSVEAEFYRLLKETEPHVVDELVATQEP